MCYAGGKTAYLQAGLNTYEVFFVSGFLLFQKWFETYDNLPVIGWRAKQEAKLHSFRPALANMKFSFLLVSKMAR